LETPPPKVSNSDSQQPQQRSICPDDNNDPVVREYCAALNSDGTLFLKSLPLNEMGYIFFSYTGARPIIRSENKNKKALMSFTPRLSSLMSV
jgi:hypothetical protein